VNLEKYFVVEAVIATITRSRIFSHTVFNWFIEAKNVVDKVCVRKKCEYLRWEGQEIVVGREKYVPSEN
jgi:hypothetical protein